MISAQSETKTLQLKMEPLKTELKSKRDQLKQAGGNLGQEQGQLQGLEKSVATLQVGAALELPFPLKLSALNLA